MPCALRDIASCVRRRGRGLTIDLSPAKLPPRRKCKKDTLQGAQGGAFHETVHNMCINTHLCMYKHAVIQPVNPQNTQKRRVFPGSLPEPRRRGFAIAGARPLRKYDKKALHSAGNPTLRGCNPTYATACRPTFLYRHKKARLSSRTAGLHI